MKAKWKKPQLSCAVASLCANSPLYITPGPHIAPYCDRCRLAPGQESFSGVYWRPIAAAAGTKHPQLVQEAKDARKRALVARALRRRQRLPQRRKVAAAAKKAEQDTGTAIQATLASGRVLNDGDHRWGTELHLDTKLQSQRSSWLIEPEELEKIRGQAAVWHRHGALVLVNRHGRRVVAMDLADFTALLGAHSLQAEEGKS